MRAIWLKNGDSSYHVASSNESSIDQQGRIEARFLGHFEGVSKPWHTDARLTARSPIGIPADRRFVQEWLRIRLAR